ncbi:MAG: DNA-binding NarL/FixJ family response regulator [Candidatus Omnitrophota bacterium]|jgi:DNA-binding NarL/FixJ family response regulator
MKKNSKTKKIKVKIMIVDDHPIMRRGLAELIHLEDDLVMCAEAESISTALELIKLHKPKLILVDLSLKDENGLELVKDIKVRFPAVLMLVLSMHDETFYAERALRAGARGYIMKQQAPSLIVIAIRRILSGEVYLSDTMSAKILRKIAGEKNTKIESPVDSLSDRELEVFRLLGSGLGTRQIAKKLSRSVKTVESYREHIKLKLDLKDSSELVQNAIQWSKINS